MIVALGQAGYEGLLAQEMAVAFRAERRTPNAERPTPKLIEDGTQPAQEIEKGPGWVALGTESGTPNAERRTLNVERSMPKSEQVGFGQRPQGIPGAVTKSESDFVYDDLAFAHMILRDTVEIRGESVNSLAQQLADFFMQGLKGEKVESVWPCLFAGPAEVVGLGRRVGGVERAFQELLRKRISRVAKLAAAETPRGTGQARGLFVFFSDFGHAFAAREAWLGGQRRMADDDAAPSRSFLKVEEAYGVLGREPQPGETVCDLGAAPGGWSYSAAKRGARVVAVDNGPLKGGALGHPQIEHRREDAFNFSPKHGEKFDWLFCDLVEEPHHVLEDIVRPWLARGWCRRFVINLKFGRVDPIALLSELRAPTSPFAAHAAAFRVRHLYHDREEFTVVGNRE